MKCPRVRQPPGADRLPAPGECRAKEGVVLNEHCSRICYRVGRPEGAGSAFRKQTFLQSVRGRSRMKGPVSIVVAIAVAITSAAASFTPTQATALPRAVPAAVSEAASSGVTEVRHKQKFRRQLRKFRKHAKRHHSNRRYAVHRGRYYRDYHSHRRYRYYDRGYYYRDRDDDDEIGAAVVAGIIGLAAGAIIAGQAHGGSSYHAVCARKYGSYDPRSGTYLGYDGYRHRCRAY